MTSRPRVYLAARFERKAEMYDLAAKWGNEIDFTSSWYRLETNEESNHSVAFLRECAERDLQDVAASTHFVLFTEPEAAIRGGRHVETGYALALHKYIHLIGKPENIFHRLAGILIHDSADECLRLIAREVLE